jgi:hypothetical protein
MKRVCNSFFQILAIAVLLFPGSSKAQLSLKGYYNIDWQVNVPLGNNFSDNVSGWGMNIEGGYYVTDNIAVGGFLNFHTNNEYFSRRTLPLSGTLSMSTDQQHQMFTLPFGALVRYRFVEADFQPYVGMKLGACYSEFNNYYYIYVTEQKRWGFYMSPEVGFNWYPWPNSVGFHAAIYYSFASNRCNLMSYDQSNLNNFGLRIGVAF